MTGTEDVGGGVMVRVVTAPFTLILGAFALAVALVAAVLRPFVPHADGAPDGMIVTWRDKVLMWSVWATVAGMSVPVWLPIVW